MLEVTIPAQEYYDEDRDLFIQIKETTLQLEHSLISLHKWEAKTHKPFLGREKTAEEILEYIKCMTIGKVDPEIYNYIPETVIKEIIDYIKDPMSATWFYDRATGTKMSNKNETITAEVIYYCMITLNIPVKFEKWHLQQLLTLIRVINDKNGEKKRMSPREAEAYRAAENARRRAKLNSKG